MTRTEELRFVKKSGTLRTFSEQRRAEFEEATVGITFTKDFNVALEAVMYDPLETIAARVLAWVKRKSWGNNCLFCVQDPNGDLAFQVDCAKNLNVDKRRVSAAMRYFIQRGYIEMRGTAKVVYPVVSPVLAKPPDKDEKSGEYRTFLQDWKVSHSTDFQELEVACSTVKRLRKVLLSAYKEWRTSRTSAGDINKEERKERDIERTPPPQPSSLHRSSDGKEQEEEEEATQALTVTPEVLSPAPTFREFAKDYPPGKVDPDSKPAFEALNPQDRIDAKAALAVYRRCEQWQNPQYIPFASKYIKKRYWEFDPLDVRRESPGMARTRQELNETILLARAMRRQT